MDEELVLLTSYFNLANGRRQDTADTFRVDPSLPSRTSPDGTAALYIVTESSTSGNMGPRARRLAADTVAWEYSTHGDDAPPPRLRAALRTAHEEVLREFDGHVAVGISVIAIEHDDVYLAQVAPGQVYVLNEGSLHSISATVEGSSPFARALGAPAGPEVSVFRDKIGPNDVVAVCSSWFHRTADADSLRHCFEAGTADDITDCLLELAKQHGLRDATVIVIEAVPDSQLAQNEQGDAAPSFTEQVDMAVHALAGVGRMLMAELRGQPLPRNDRGAPAATAVAEPEHERAPGPASNVATSTRPDEYTTETPHLGAEAASGGAAEAWNPEATNTYDLAAAQPDAETETRPRRREQPTEEVPAVQPDEIAPEQAEEPAREDPRRRTPRRPEPVTDLDRVNSRIQYEPDMSDVIPPVQAFPEPSTTEPERIYASNRNMQGANKRPRRFGGGRNDASGAAPVVRPRLQDLDIRRPMGQQAPPWMVWLGAAILGLLVIAAFFVWRHNRSHPKAVNPYPAMVQADIQRVRTAPSPAAQDAAISKARRDIATARQNGATPKQVQSWRTNLQLGIDVAYKVTRVTATRTDVDFSKFSGAQPTQLATGATNLFVLDSGRKAVFSISNNSSPNQIVQSGETDSGLQITTPIQLTTSGDTALVLDDSNNLVRAQGGTKTAIVLTKASAAQKVVAMTNFGADVYLLDVAGSQVWKYADAVSGTATQPTGFFPTTGSSGPDLANATSLVLDDKGMYILKSDGSILKYDDNAAKQPFSGQLRANLPKFNKPVSIFTDVGLKYVWVADPANGRIVQFDKDGKYIREYVSGTNAMDLSQIKGIVAPPGGKTLYVLSGQKLYDFPVQP